MDIQPQNQKNPLPPKLLELASCILKFVEKSEQLETKKKDGTAQKGKGEINEVK